MHKNSLRMLYKKTYVNTYTSMSLRGELSLIQIMIVCAEINVHVVQGVYKVLLQFQNFVMKSVLNKS